MDRENEFRTRILQNFKSDIFKAQRLYYLSQKFGDRISAPVQAYCKDVVNRYTKIAKDMELQLTMEELYNRLLDK